MKQLSSQSADLFREIVNIGASQSSNALARRFGRPVRITVPMLRELELEEAAGVLGSPEMPVEAVLVLFGGAFRGGVLLALSPEDGANLREALCADTGDESGEAQENALIEVLHAFVSSAATFLFAELSPELTRALCDMAGSLVTSLLGELDYEVDSLWLAEVDMLPDGGERILAQLFFLGDEGFYRLIDEMAG